MASSTVFPNEMTSSKYTRQRDHRMPHNTRSMSRSNVAGALHSPNGITRNWNNPSFVTKAAFFFASGDMAACQYALARSIVENHCWFPNNRKESSILGNGYASLTVNEFNRRYSTQKRVEPSFFVTSTTGEAQGLSLGSICPPDYISLTQSCSLLRPAGASRRCPQRIGLALLISISCWTDFDRQVTGSPGAGNTCSYLWSKSRKD